jgi:hypothetical protein
LAAIGLTASCSATNPDLQVIRQPRKESGVGAARVHQESTTVQVQHGAPGPRASGVEFAGAQAAQLPIDDPASRRGPGEKARRSTGAVEERAHPVEVVVVSTKRRLAHPTEHRVGEAQGDAAPWLLTSQRDKPHPPLELSFFDSDKTPRCIC